MLGSDERKGGEAEGKEKVRRAENLWSAACNRRGGRGGEVTEKPGKKPKTVKSPELRKALKRGRGSDDAAKKLKKKKLKSKND